MKRAVLFVLDSVGIGGANDAERFGDTGSNTVGHILEAASRGEATLRAEVALGIAGGDLVYLEELGSAGDAGRQPGWGGPVPPVRCTCGEQYPAHLTHCPQCGKPNRAR